MLFFPYFSSSHCFFPLITYCLFLDYHMHSESSEVFIYVEAEVIAPSPFSGTQVFSVPIPGTCLTHPSFSSHIFYLTFFPPPVVVFLLPFPHAAFA